MLIITGSPTGQLLLPGNGDNGSSCELDIKAIDGRHTDSDVEAYIANRIVEGEYRDAERAMECDVFKTFARTNLIRRGCGKKAVGPIHGFERSLKSPKRSSESPKRSGAERT